MPRHACFLRDLVDVGALPSGRRFNFPLRKRFLELLLNGLESGSLLPPGLRAKPLVVDGAFQVSGQNIQPDAIVEFTVSRPVSTSIIAVIELKSRLQPMGLEGAIHQVLRARNELHRTGAYHDLYPW